MFVCNLRQPPNVQTIKCMHTVHFAAVTNIHMLVATTLNTSYNCTGQRWPVLISCLNKFSIKISTQVLLFLKYIYLADSVYIVFSFQDLGKEYQHSLDFVVVSEILCFGDFVCLLLFWFYFIACVWRNGTMKKEQRTMISTKFKINTFRIWLDVGGKDSNRAKICQLRPNSTEFWKL